VTAFSASLRPLGAISVNFIKTIHCRSLFAIIAVSFGCIMKHPTDLLAPGIRVRQIAQSDIPATVGLLARGFKAKPREFWARVFACLDQHHTPSGFPRYGYLIETGGMVVGAVIQIFTAIPTGSGIRIRCNVSSWFVQEPFRSYASLLVSKALSRPNVTYLNVTPAPHTLSIIEAQGYSRYSRGVFVAVPALQLSLARRARHSRQPG
jgi:hypothetical protein